MFNNKMKYIMVGYNRPVLFLDTWNHDDMANNLMVANKVTSAGFVMFSEGKVCCYGKSVTLEIGPSKLDAEVISKALGIE